MVTVFTPSNEEWNQGIIGLKDMHGNNVMFNDIVMLMGQEYGIYLIPRNCDDSYGCCLTDDRNYHDNDSVIKFDEFLDYEDIRIVGKFDKKNKILVGKIGKSEKCMSYLAKKRQRQYNQ